MISGSELEKAHNQMARIVARHGEKYLPIFERLENELNEQREKYNLMQRALEAAKSSTEQIK